MCQNVTRSEKDAILYCKEKGFRPESDTPKNSPLVVAFGRDREVTEYTAKYKSLLKGDIFHVLGFRNIF